MCSGSMLDASQNLRTLNSTELQVKMRSAEYAKVKEKLAAGKVGAGQAGRLTPNQRGPVAKLATARSTRRSACSVSGASLI